MRLLIVEDEIGLCVSIAQGLTIGGYAVAICYDGEEAIELITNEIYDLVILDLNLPKMDGIVIVAEVRKQNQEVKIYILSARGSVTDKVIDLAIGANEYLTKPFDFSELAARIRFLLRQHYIQENKVFVWNNRSLDSVRRAVHVNNKQVILTKKELALLEYVMLNPQKVISTEELMNHVWNTEADRLSNVVRVHIASLRKKLRSELNYEPISTKIEERYHLFQGCK